MKLSNLMSDFKTNAVHFRYDPDGKGHVNHADFISGLTGTQFTPGDAVGTSQQIVTNSHKALEEHHHTQMALQDKITQNQANRSTTIGVWDVLQQLK